MSGQRNPVLTGGCRCGAVRYALYAKVCQARSCRHLSLPHVCAGTEVNHGSDDTDEDRQAGQLQGAATRRRKARRQVGRTDGRETPEA